MMDYEQEMYNKYAWMAPELWDEERCVFNVKDTETHHVDIMPLIFTFAIVLTPKTDPMMYEDRWCYNSFETAHEAAKRWDASGWVSAVRFPEEPYKCEPQGWHRHPQSGRRRVDGSWEYVMP